MDYFFFGIQGSGKGTQTRLLAEEFNLPVFETGAELRAMAASGTELGDRVKEIIEAGHLVPTEIVMEIVAEFLDNHQEAETIIFDGIPRSKDQQEQLHELLSEYGRDFTAVFIHLSDEEAMTRLLARGRSDDKPESIERRIKNFYEKTTPILEFYKERDAFIEVEGEQTIEEVYADIKSSLELN